MRTFAFLFLGGLLSSCQSGHEVLREPAAASKAAEFLEQVAQDARRLGISGDDLLACINSKGRLVLGGVSSFGKPLKIIGYDGDRPMKMQMVTDGLFVNEYIFNQDGLQTTLSFANDSHSGRATLENLEGPLGTLNCKFQEHIGSE